VLALSGHREVKRSILSSLYFHQFSYCTIRSSGRTSTSCSCSRSVSGTALLSTVSLHSHKLGEWRLTSLLYFVLAVEVFSRRFEKVSDVKGTHSFVRRLELIPSASTSHRNSSHYEKNSNSNKLSLHAIRPTRLLSPRATPLLLLPILSTRSERRPKEDRATLVCTNRRCRKLRKSSSTTRSKRRRISMRTCRHWNRNSEERQERNRVNRQRWRDWGK